MIRFDEELREIFGDRYEGCTQAGDELVEYRLKPGEAATSEELAQVEVLLHGGMRTEVDELKTKLDDLQARIEKVERA